MLEKFKLKKDVRWLLLACIGVGTLIAFPVIAQFFAAKLLEPVASLWGSALGAFAGIAGAFWVAERQSAKQQRAAAGLVRQMFEPIPYALDKLVSIYGAPSRPERGETDEEPDVLSIEKWQEVAMQARFVINLYKTFNSRIHRYEAGLNLLSAKSLRTALLLEAALEAVITDVTPLATPPQIYNFETTSTELRAQAPTWSSRFALATFNREIQNFMDELERMSD